MRAKPLSAELRHSIYDLSLDYLLSFDWSRPLLVQASRQCQFDEVAGLLTERLALDTPNTTRLTGSQYTATDTGRARRLVIPESQLSARTPHAVGRFHDAAYTIAAVVSQGPAYDAY